MNLRSIATCRNADWQQASGISLQKMMGVANENRCQYFQRPREMQIRFQVEQISFIQARPGWLCAHSVSSIGSVRHKTMLCLVCICNILWAVGIHVHSLHITPWKLYIYQPLSSVLYPLFNLNPSVHTGRFFRMLRSRRPFPLPIIIRKGVWNRKHSLETRRNIWS